MQSLGAEANLLTLGSAAKRCSIHTDLWIATSYSFVLSLAALRLGIAATQMVAARPQIFTAIYGPYFDIVLKNRQAYVIADVMTKTAHEGRNLVYEGYLVELSLNGSRGINFVCLEGASRFYLALGREASRTTVRHRFQRIDRNTDRISRITIPGQEIANLVTRTYTSVEVGPVAAPEPPAGISRRAILLLRWLAVGR